MVDDAQSEKEIGRAVTTAFDYLRPDERTLRNLHKSCFSPTGAMRRELFRWVNPEQYGRITSYNVCYTKLLRSSVCSTRATGSGRGV